MQSKQDVNPNTGKRSDGPEFRSLVQELMARGVQTVEPEIGIKGISYPSLSFFFPNKSDEEVNTFLEKLVEEGIFVARLLDKIAMCPACGSTFAYSKYSCPLCSSFDIGKVTIIEHTKCGFIGPVRKFKKVDELICPKCQTAMSQLDRREIGSSFECEKCDARFESPQISHKCESCGKPFTFKESRYEPVLEYSLSEDAKREASKITPPIEAVAEPLRRSGFSVKTRANIIGKSGATYTFDIIAQKKKSVVIGNFTFEPKEEEIKELFVRKHDVDPALALLISTLRPSKEQESISETYDVAIISPKNWLSMEEQIAILITKKKPQGKKSGGTSRKLK